MKYLTLILFLVYACTDDDVTPNERRAYIVGFDPCTIQHSYKIGYVIITEDLKDTLMTYSLSDEVFTMPASILSHTNDTLYSIPEAYFGNYGNSVFFPDSLRYKYPIDIEYADAKEEEMVFNVCLANIIALILPQIIIESVSN